MSLARLPVLECWWSARRLDRYLDEDPDTAMNPRETERLERHLAVCARCASSAADRERVRAALHRLGERRRPDPAALDRLGEVAVRLRAEDDA